MATTQNYNLPLIETSEYSTKLFSEFVALMCGNNNASALNMLDSILAGKENTHLIFTNVTASNWVSDNTYSDYAYKCELTCQGITANSVVEVIFDVDEATSGDYAPVCLSGANTVTIYSKVNDSITIPVIKEI